MIFPGWAFLLLKIFKIRNYTCIMKKIILIVTIVLYVTPSFCQRNKITSFKDWKIDENRSLVWQSVFEDSAINSLSLIHHLKRYSWIRDIEVREGVIFANAINYMFDYRKYVGTWDLPYIYRSGKWNWSIIVDFKENKYRVTIASITFDAGSVEGGYLDIPISGPYDDVVLRKDRLSFKPGQLNYLDVFGMDLISNFTVRKVVLDDW